MYAKDLWAKDKFVGIVKNICSSVTGDRILLRTKCKNNTPATRA